MSNGGTEADELVYLREYDILQVLALVEATFIQRYIIAQSLPVIVPPSDRVV
ncbi:MAG: hypothetical protein R3E08_01910 [Thiotrichaceae bacterium]